jgi:hypothetical protein
MATHATPASMLKESLIESLEAAKFCVDYRKIDDKWGDFKTGGCLGYPGAILLFSIIDSIGSYYRNNKSFKIPIDSKDMTIDSDGWQHFKILNSKLFNQNLSLDFIKKLYSEFRSYLTHNSVLGKNSMMIMDNESLEQGISGIAFFKHKTNDGKEIQIISIKELWELCKSAIDEFSKEIDTVVPNSKQGKNFH